MYAHNTLLPEIGQKDFHQLFGDPSFLICRIDRKAVDLERPATVKEHGSAENKTGDPAVSHIFQAVCLFGFEQLLYMNSSILWFPRIIPWLTGKGCGTNSAIFIKMFNSAKLNDRFFFHRNLSPQIQIRMVAHSSNISISFVVALMQFSSPSSFR